MSGAGDLQQQRWDAVAAGWARWWPTIERGAQPVSERMLVLARVGPGKRVLDLATGFGEPALRAARRVGAAGRVVATDLSAGMLEIARARAAQLRLANVEFIQADAGHLGLDDGAFDAVLCRWGLADLPDPPAMLRDVRRMLAPGGAFAEAVWEGGSSGRPLAALAADVAAEVFGPPAPEAPADAGTPPPAATAADLERQLVEAGFVQVQVESLALTLQWPGVEECIDYLFDVSPDLSARLSAHPAATQVRYRQRLAGRLRQHAGADGSLCIRNRTLCAVAHA